jgi:hypothetical protein
VSLELAIDWEAIGGKPAHGEQVDCKSFLFSANVVPVGRNLARDSCTYSYLYPVPGILVTLVPTACSVGILYHLAPHGKDAGNADRDLRGLP